MILNPNFKLERLKFYFLANIEIYLEKDIKPINS